MSTFNPPLLPDPVVPASRACRRRNDTRHVPGTCRRPPGPVGVAVPLRDSTRHHGGRDTHLRLVAPRHTPRLVGLPASYLRPDGVRAGGLRRAPWANPPGRARLRRDSLRRDGGYLTTAALLAPFTAPLPQVLGLGTLILAVPWWTHRRRRPMQDQALTRGVPDDQVPFLPADLVPVEREARAVRLGDIEARDPVSVCEEGSTSARASLDSAPDQVAVGQDANARSGGRRRCRNWTRHLGAYPGHQGGTVSRTGDAGCSAGLFSSEP
jgi:hypothetical protein